MTQTLAEIELEIAELNKKAAALRKESKAVTLQAEVLKAKQYVGKYFLRTTKQGINYNTSSPVSMGYSKLTWIHVIELHKTCGYGVQVYYEIIVANKSDVIDDAPIFMEFSKLVRNGFDSINDSLEHLTRNDNVVSLKEITKDDFEAAYIKCKAEEYLFDADYYAKHKRDKVDVEMGIWFDKYVPDDLVSKLKNND